MADVSRYVKFVIWGGIVWVFICGVRLGSSLLSKINERVRGLIYFAFLSSLRVLGF